MSKEEPNIDLKEAFREYARKELEFYQKANKNKLYHRVLPNIKEKDKGSIDFYYNGVTLGQARLRFNSSEYNTRLLNYTTLADYHKPSQL